MNKKKDCTESLANVIFSTGISRVYNNVCRKYFSYSVEKLKDDDATKMAYSLRLEATIFFLPFPICFISLAPSLPLFFHPSVSSYLSLLSRSPSILSSFDFSTPPPLDISHRDFLVHSITRLPFIETPDFTYLHPLHRASYDFPLQRANDDFRGPLNCNNFN